MKTAISLPDPLFKLAEETAAKLGISRSALFALALEEYIKKHHPQKITRQLDTLYSKHESTLDNKVFEAQLLSIEEDW